MKNFFTRVLGVCSLIVAFSFATTEASAQCAAAPGPGVDVNNPCYAAVITADPFCCNISWDSLCQNAYTACTGGGGPVTCAAAPPPCVDIASSAYATVIANDPFCCNIFWDGICQSAYDNLNGSCLCPATPPSCVVINSVAYNQVIVDDPFCCQTDWDSVCQDAYDALSNSCTGACITPPPGIDTSNPCYTQVITNDPFCCNFAWDSICQNAYDICIVTSSCVTPPACVVFGGAAYLQVIADDPFCCQTDWDSLCQDAYDALSNSCTGACITPPPGIDTSNPCYTQVITNDPFCCNTAWDSLCQNAYNACTGGGGPCSAIPGPGVDTNSACYTQVITNDPFCCNTSWDSLCQNAYNACTGGGGPCSAIPGPGVDTNSACYTQVITNDPFCCNIQWDGLCQTAYDDCISTCTTTPPACVDVNSAAYSTVIANDPFCCFNTWDSICQDAYDALSNSCAPTCNVDGGTVSTTSPTTGLCIGDGKPNVVQLTVSGNVGVGVFGIVQQNTLNVVATNASGTFNIESLGAGPFLAGYVSVENLSQLQGITNVNQLSGCFDLSNPITITTITLAPGTLTASGPTTVCGGNVTVSVSGNVGPQQRYVLLNQTATQVIAINQTGVFNFNTLANGIYRVVSISYAGVNLNTITPPTLPACLVASNLLTFTKVSCVSATLGSNPNPTTGTSWVSFTVPTDDFTTLEVYDMSGRKVADLFNTNAQKDVEYRLEFNGAGLPNGVYIYRLTTGSEVIVDKFMIAK